MWHNFFRIKKVELTSIQILRKLIVPHFFSIFLESLSDYCESILCRKNKVVITYFVASSPPRKSTRYQGLNGVNG